MSEGSVVSGASVRQGQALAGRYVLGEILGRGGMADVYRATDLRLERPVAVKVLRQPGLATDERGRFLAEARTLAALSHPGLVTLLDVYSGDDCTFLVMELVEGNSLSNVTQTQPPSQLRAVEIGRQLAKALSYVHQQGVVHRDIKPGNVLIGSDDRVRLADFGIARVLGDATRHTATGFTIGTAAYVAPEQLLGGDISGAADIYALGLVLLECLSGTPAFQGTPAEVSLARVSASPRIPQSLPDEWQSLLSDMTAIDPSQRPAASEVCDRLTAMTVTDAAQEAAATQPLNLQHTRPLTTPMPVDEDLLDTGSAAEDPVADGPAATTMGLPDRVKSDVLSRDRWRATASRHLNVLARFSTRMQLISLAVLMLIVVATIGIVVSSAGDGASTRDRAPDVPGKIGRDLQALHDAVYP